MYLCVCVCVLVACAGMWMTACQWKGCHYLADVCVWAMTGGRVTSVVRAQHCPDRKHYFMISLQDRSTRHNLQRCSLTSFQEVIAIHTTEKCGRLCACGTFMTIAWWMAISKVLFLYQGYYFRITKWGFFFFCFVLRALKRGALVNLSPPCPYPLTFSVLQQCRGV